MSPQRAVIIGAGHAGAQLAASLRQEKWAGEIVLIGDEGALPYQRPPLSKAYLAGKSTLEALAIRNADFYAKQDIRILSGTVHTIGREASRLTMSGGEELTYDKLALCTGARPRKLDVPGADLDGVYYLRTAADVELIRAAARPGRRAVLVGGGYVGLETAASLRAVGLEVTVLEATERVLERVSAPEISAFFNRVHREEGVDIRCNAFVHSISGDGHVSEVVLTSGEVVPADLVIIGIGVEPNTELAAATGLTVDNGIVIDGQAKTSDPDIVAAGDCAIHHSTRYDRPIRVESVPNAGEHAKIAASTINGGSKHISALPWFWSDQYNVKLQIAGLNSAYDEIVIDGTPERDRDFSCFYLRQGRLIAADCINRPRDFMFAKQALTRQPPISRAELPRTPARV